MMLSFIECMGFMLFGLFICMAFFGINFLLAAIIVKLKKIKEEDATVKLAVWLMVLELLSFFIYFNLTQCVGGNWIYSNATVSIGHTVCIG